MVRRLRARKAIEGKSAKKTKNGYYVGAGVLIIVIIAALLLMDFYSSPPADNSYTPPTNQPQVPEEPSPPNLPPMPPPTTQTANFAIDSVTTSSSSVSIRNAGSQTIRTSDVYVYVGGELRSCTWVSDVTTIPPSTLRQCIFDGARCSGGQSVTVTIYSTSHSVKC